jgi:hypothetical protein
MQATEYRRESVNNGVVEWWSDGNRRMEGWSIENKKGMMEEWNIGMIKTKRKKDGRVECGNNGSMATWLARGSVRSIPMIYRRGM